MSPSQCPITLDYFNVIFSQHADLSTLPCATLHFGSTKADSHKSSQMPISCYSLAESHFICIVSTCYPTAVLLLSSGIITEARRAYVRAEANRSRRIASVAIDI